jgi:hypothetical protein
MEGDRNIPDTGMYLQKWTEHAYLMPAYCSEQKSNMDTEDKDTWGGLCKDVRTNNMFYLGTRNVVQNLVRENRNKLGGRGNKIPTPAETCKISEGRLIDIHNIHDLDML